MRLRKKLLIFTVTALLLVFCVWRYVRFGTKTSKQTEVFGHAWNTNMTKKHFMLRPDNSVQRASTKTATTMKQAPTETATKAPEQKPTQKSENLVLFYTPFSGSTPWPRFRNTHDFSHFKGRKCKVANCKLTYDKNDLSRSDAVVFYGKDMPVLSTMKEISRNRNHQQRWIIFTQEDPRYLLLGTQYYNNFFNWTMNYRRDADIYAPRTTYKSINSKVIKYAQGKDKLIALNTGFDECSNNFVYPKNKVIGKLAKYIDITVFGECSQMFGQANTCAGPACDQLLKRFKFYLSFENAACIDFVSDKYWHVPFKYDMVPIVLGPPKYDAKIAIPGSYINVMDFASLKDLANYLKYLDKNDTAYNEYFQWKIKYEVQDEYPWNCELCERLNDPSLPVKVYDSLGTYWGQESACGDIEAAIKKKFL